MLELDKVNFKYSNKNSLFNNLTYVFEVGKVYGISGMNGSGKTTLLRCINKDLRFNGSITLNGRNYTQSDTAFLPTDFFVYEELLGSEFYRLFENGTKSFFNFKEYADQLQIPLSNTIDTYSAGQKKKLLALCILSLSRKILLLDEPFNAIDKESVNILLPLIQECANKGAIVLVTQHNDVLLKALCNDEVVLKKI
jgi:ABC-2 type transport system ATP-binding protein